MSAKHTPGPWVWAEDRWHGGFSGIDGPSGEEVLRANSANDGDTGAAWFEDFPSAADRALIAAAPDMLAALKAARQFIENGIEFGFVRMPDPSTTDPAHNTLPAINAAIAAATGSAE